MSERILQHLALVDHERALREADPDLHRVVQALKRYQQRRFEGTYADLLASDRYRPAARFFLDELYGPAEFKDRDEQFARIVPKIDRLFPSEVNEVVLDLARLHALSEQFDTQMARCLREVPLNRPNYLQAWQQVGRQDDRRSQLDLVLGIGRALDHLTQHAWLVTALRLMRTPARAAGLGALQAFLESGMASFRAMRGAADFLRTVQQREGLLLNALFSGAGPALEELPDP